MWDQFTDLWNIGREKFGEPKINLPNLPMLSTAVSRYTVFSHTTYVDQKYIYEFKNRSRDQPLPQKAKHKVGIMQFPALANLSND